ncbi:MAG: peptidylprolyl isomerase [Bacteroidaceae bacterium]|nr:peptidylprolyl isomerase [Bacteroidaceae bacterium]
MNKISSIVASLFFSFSMVSFAQTGSANNVIDEVIWIVGDEAIMKSDVEHARIDGLAQGQRWDGDPYCVIPEQLAVQKLFLHQAAIDSIEVSDNDVFQNVNQRIDWYIGQLGSKEKMEEYFNKSTTQIREQLYNYVKDDEMVRQVRQNLVSNIKVTPAQVRRYFKDVPEDSIPFVSTKVEVEIIVRNPKIEQEEIDRVKAELRDYTERINNGITPFSSLAIMYSEDPGSARRGGDLGDYMGRGMLVPEFANVAFNLTDPKAVSKIVESEYGFHIIQLIDKKGDKVKVRHILRKPRVSDAAIANAMGELDSIANDIRKGLYAFEDSTQFLSDDKDTRNNHGLMVNRTMYSESEGTPKFELKELPTEIAKVVAGMNIGEISKPFVMQNNKGKEVVAIVKLKNKIEGHHATLADDYQVLQNVVVEKMSQEKIENWIKEKMKTTYIRINDDWKNCEFQYSGWIK